MSRRYTETEKIQCGESSSVFVHHEYDDSGRLVGAWISCCPRHQNKDFGDLIKELSKRLHDAITQARAL